MSDWARRPLNFSHEAVYAYEALRGKQSEHANGEWRPFDRLAMILWMQLLLCTESVRIGGSTRLNLEDTGTYAV